MISPELGVDTLQRGVPLGLGALDAIEIVLLVSGIIDADSLRQSSYPLRCALRDWLCWDAFFDSVEFVNLCNYKRVFRHRESPTGHCDGFRLEARR